MKSYNSPMSISTFKIDEINVNANDIFDITKRLVSSYSYDELYYKIIHDSYFSGMFYTFLKTNKTYILKEVIDFYYDNHVGSFYEKSMKPFIEFLIDSKNHKLFLVGLTSFFEEDYFKEFLRILFINKNILEEKFEEIKKILEDEKNILDKETYEIILKEEFLNSLNSL